MHRRHVLAAAGGTVAAATAGCLGTLIGDDSTTDEPAGDGTTTSGTADGAHHLFVENLTETTETGRVTVTDGDDDTVVDGRYEFPDGRGIKFESIAEWAATYTIDLAIDDEDPVSFEWQTPECGPDSEAPNGSRNGSVRINAPESDDGSEQDRVTFVVDQCDAIHSPTVSVGPADAFRLDD